MSRRLSLESDLRIMKTGSWEIKEEGESEQDHEGTWQQGVSYGKTEGTNIHWAHSLTLCVVLANLFLCPFREVTHPIFSFFKLLFYFNF